MAQLSAVQVGRLALNAGILHNQLAMSIAIAWAESGLRTDATGYNPGPRPGTVASRDRGLWQINDYWHSEVSNACAYDGACCARAMVRISNAGRNWNPWSTYGNGAYRRYLGQSQVAANLILSGSGGPAPAPPPNRADAAIAEVRRGVSPLTATTHFMQGLWNDLMNVKYQGRVSVGDILGGWFK